MDLTQEEECCFIIKSERTDIEEEEDGRSCLFSIARQKPLLLLNII